MTDAAELQAALRDTAKQRDEFKATAERLTQEVVQLQSHVGACSDQLVATEQSHNEHRAHWAAKIEEAEQSFSQDMLTREDLEAMRVQIVEQAEAPWRQRAATLEQELGQAREAAQMHRRDAERARTALESAKLEASAALRESEVRSETQIAELQAKLELIETAPRGGPGSEESAERSRRLQREHAEATVRAQKLLEEVEELRREADGLVNLRSELLAANAGLQGEAKAQQRVAAADKASLDRRCAHLQSELDASAAAQQRMHEAALHAEQEMRSLRAAADDAQHDAANERSAAGLRLAEAQREVSALRMELERRQTESVRREALLQRSRDELAQTAAQNERDASAAIASAREEEASRIKRLEAERVRLNDQLLTAQNDAAAAAAAARDRSDALSGECAALKAEVHSASLEKAAAIEDASRLRRRADEAEERMSAALSELHTLRMESSETFAHKGKIAEVEAAATIAQEKLSMQLAFAQKEATAFKAQRDSDVTALADKLKQVKRIAVKERQASQDGDASRRKQIDTLKREVMRLRGEREQLKRELRDRSAGVGGAIVSSHGALRPAASLEIGGGAAGMSEGLRSLLAAESALVDEAAALRQQAAAAVAQVGA